MLSHILSFAAFLLPQEEGPLVAPDQIAWQRNIEDARAIAAAEHRPLFVAINVDGESGSDRIVNEEYRDPAFVAWTRHFVCAIGHPSRHTPRDHDDRGRRIPCPRLGSVTCGEHMALEPAIFDAYLGGERVSPRHALILPDGTKAFDLSYLFDMTALDEAVEKAAATAPPDPTRDAWFAKHATDDEFLDALAGARTSWQREVFELFWRQESTPETAAVLVRAIGRTGDAGSIEALRLALQGASAPPSDLLAGIAGAARARGFAPDLAVALRGVLSGAGRYPGQPSLGSDRHLLPVLARTAGTDRSQRSLVVAHAALADASDRAAALEALENVLSPADKERVTAAIGAAGGPVDLEDLLRLGAELHAAVPASPPIPLEPARTMDELVAELEASERALAGNEADPRAARRFGLANLKLAQARSAESGPDVGLLLQDADTWLARAAAALPDDDLLALERARTAYLLSRFDEQGRIAGEVLARVRARSTPSAAARAVLERWPAWGSGSPSGFAEAERAAALAADDTATEALRWLGDAEGRRIGADSDDPAREAAGFVRGARALATACASLEAKDVDFQSLASYLRAIGSTRPSLATLRVGLERFPESAILRDLVREVLVQCGRPDVLVEISDWLAGRNPESGACAWYAGYAHVLAAEWARRGEDHEQALSAYGSARERFQRSIELQPGFADSAGHYLAACELGRGFAYRGAGRRQDAADALARALEQRSAIGDARDGLDREALDLVDSVLEWTAAGPSPVNTTAFADALSRAVPGETRWLLAVSDAALREGLRADGRVRTRIPVPAALRVPGGPDTALEPAAIGDRWLADSIDVARRAQTVADDTTTRRYLAQTLTIQAERDLVRGRDAEAEPLLTEAAQLLAEPAQVGESVVDIARRLRERLGDARPVARPGR
ncbi:MAG: hypothetical protein NTY35_14550 [Planctomycetota bacterium]|nr:hypothetical protein [Planctomycetota bacterium]